MIMTQDEVAAMFHCHRSRISPIERKALKKLRCLLEDDALERLDEDERRARPPSGRRWTKKLRDRLSGRTDGREYQD